MIENLIIQKNKIIKMSLSTISKISINEWVNINQFASFIKGIEVGSKSYSDQPNDNTIPYYRVGDLLSSSTNVFIDKELRHQKCVFDDVLISFDGAPGRVNIGCVGAFSSGIQKLICDRKLKGLVFFSLLSPLNQDIIKKHSQGTTILHASKSIEYLMMPKIDECLLSSLDIYFNHLVIINKKISKLKKAKERMLNKYFTNQ